eukprot:841167-Pelagomonas_calceolata.AAC.2
MYEGTMPTKAEASMPAPTPLCCRSFGEGCVMEGWTCRRCHVPTKAEASMPVPVPLPCRYFAIAKAA